MITKRCGTQCARVALIPCALLITAATSSCANFARHRGPVVPDRPGYTDVPTALPAGALQLEVGYTDDRVETADYKSIGEALLRIGVGARSELRLFGNSFAIRKVNDLPSVHGMEDPKVGVKTNLHAKPDSVQSALPNIALLAAVTLPLGATAFRTVHAQPEVKIAANWTTPSPFSLYSNVGAGGVYDGSNWGERGWVSVALWYAANPRVSVFVENISTRRLGGSAISSNAADAGITYLINDQLQIDFRAGHGYGNVSAKERFAGVGLVRRW